MLEAHAVASFLVISGVAGSYKWEARVFFVLKTERLFEHSLLATLAHSIVHTLLMYAHKIWLRAFIMKCWECLSMSCRIPIL